MDPFLLLSLLTTTPLEDGGADMDFDYWQDVSRVFSEDALQLGNTGKRQDEYSAGTHMLGIMCWLIGDWQDELEAVCEKH